MTGPLTTADEQARVLLAELVAIPSPSGAERPLARHVVKRMRELGLRAWLDPVGNACAETSGNGSPTILLLGHLDTVDQPIPASADADWVRGRGAVDAKGALAAMICAAARLRHAPYRIRVVGAVEEETPGSRGAVQVTQSARPDAVVVGEPSGWTGVVLGYKGKLDLSYEVHCPATHSSSPSIKATEALAVFWNELLDVLGPCGTAFALPSAALCSMTGDLVQARAEISCRLPMGFDVAAFVAELRTRVGTGARLEVVKAVGAVRKSRMDPVVRHLTASIRQHDVRPVHRLRAGTSDMNTLAEVWDVPMATYGPGDNTLDHSDDEQVSVAEYLRAISVLVLAVDGLAAELAQAEERP
jgi:[amino group carrier protein]-lysine/ornithine hydrolase